MKPSVVVTLLSAVCALAAPAHVKRDAKFQLYGINTSGGEFDPPKIPKLSDIDAFMADGFNTFRVLFTMEHMTPNDLGTIDNNFLGAPPADQPNGTPAPGSYFELVKHITDKGGHAVIVPWNSGKYKGQLVSKAQMTQFWTTVAKPFASDKNVIFDTNNEFTGITPQQCFDLNQGAIDGIRAAQATQMIMVEGNDYTHASTWLTSGNNDNLKGLKDPSNKLAFEMHHYLDPDLNASTEQCVNGAKTIEAASKWLADNNLMGFMGEIAGGNTPDCVQMVEDILGSMDPKHWLGALYWGGGQGDGQYDDQKHFYAFNPSPKTKAYDTYLAPLQKSFGIAASQPGQ